MEAADVHPNRTALEVGGEILSFAMLKHQAAAVAGTMQSWRDDEAPPLTAVFAYRSRTAFVGVLAAMLQGHAYVPLNRRFPADRTRTMLVRSGARAVIVDEESAKQLDDVLHGIADPMVILLPDVDEVEELARRWPAHRFIGRGGIHTGGPSYSPPPVERDALAYLLFTSGSTGSPKGVGVTHANVVPFVEMMAARYGVTEEDRFSQTFDMTFDLSVFDMFVAWHAGACVCCPSEKSLVAPGEFIRESRLSIWFSVPSTAVFMKKLGMLGSGRYPSLRWSLFCGEPLPQELATGWAASAPASTVENLYGPTEATVACTAYQWDESRSPGECELGLVPIGWALPGTSVMVVDDSLEEVTAGGEGELLLCGPQVTPGYWQDPERTAASFVVPPGRREIYYRTGDRVRSPRGDEPLRYLGRLDNQIKIRGHRVELGEIEAVIREISGVSAVLAVGWPITPSGAAGVVAFLGDTSVEVDRLRSEMSRRLPDYMVPRQIRLLPELPVNANGKFDRRAVVGILEARP